MDQKPVLGVIGGSGLYTMQGLSDVESLDMDTPFGKPTSPVFLGDLQGKRIAFIARHGIGHKYAPSEVNYRANIYALKALGVERVVSVSACGSLREDFAPGDVVIPDQLFDQTRGRARSFFGDGLVGHISVAEPFCRELGQLVFDSVRQSGGTVHHGGTFITIEGPRFSTRAESNAYRAWGMSIIGMTTCPEAFLAREAELCYTVMAHVTDYDVWHVSEAPVTVDMVVRVLKANTALAQEAIGAVVRQIDTSRSCACGHSLENALITDPSVIDPATRQKLDLLVGRYIP